MKLLSAALTYLDGAQYFQAKPLNSGILSLNASVWSIQLDVRRTELTTDYRLGSIQLSQAQQLVISS